MENLFEKGIAAVARVHAARVVFGRDDPDNPHVYYAWSGANLMLHFDKAFDQDVWASDGTHNADWESKAQSHVKSERDKKMAEMKSRIELWLTTEGKMPLGQDPLIYDAQLESFFPGWAHGRRNSFSISRICNAGWGKTRPIRPIRQIRQIRHAGGMPVLVGAPSERLAWRNGRSKGRGFLAKTTSLACEPQTPDNEHFFLLRIAN